MKYIELPRDAVGRGVPPGTEVRVGDFAHGLTIHVNESTHGIALDARRAHPGCNAFGADRLYPIGPDGLKKPLEDSGRGRTRPTVRGIAPRIRELVGEGE